MALVQTLESKVKLALLTVGMTVTGCVIICSIVAFSAFGMVSEERKMIYVLNGDIPMTAERTDQEISLEIECKAHVDLFHHYFFTLAPDNKYIEWTTGKAMYLIDESGIKQKTAMEEKGFYSMLQAASAQYSLMTDSIIVDTKQMKFRYVGRQRIERRTSVVYRNLITTGGLKRTTRTENNPHGLLITNWRTLMNDDIEKESKDAM